MMVRAASHISGGPGGLGVGPPGALGSGIRSYQPGRAEVTSECIVWGFTQGSVLIPPTPSLRSPAEAPRRSSIDVLVEAALGSDVLLVGSLRFGHSDVPILAGALLLEPANSFPVLLLRIDSTGRARVPFQVPDDPALQDRLVFLQGIVFGPGPGPIWLTNLADLRIR
jgi:hypothetical protein